MFASVLVFHVATAIVMGVSAVLLLRTLWKDDFPSVGAHIQVLSWGLCLELVSGSLLALLAGSSVSFVGFCQNIALYLSATGVVFLIAYLRTGKAIPATVLVPVLPGVVFSSLTAVRLF